MRAYIFGFESWARARWMTHRRNRRRRSADAKSSNGRRRAGEWMREGHALRANFTRTYANAHM